MKGGGFIVFLFLLFCFLWGVAVVMGGISRWVQSWGTPKPQPRSRHLQYVSRSRMASMSKS